MRYLLIAAAVVTGLAIAAGPVQGQQGVASASVSADCHYDGSGGEDDATVAVSAFPWVYTDGPSGEASDAAVACADAASRQENPDEGSEVAVSAKVGGSSDTISTGPATEEAANADERLGAVGCQEGADHPPIEVSGDDGPGGLALAAGTPSYRPGSGVVAGLGTADNPYRIEDWCIDAREWSDPPESLAAPDTANGIAIHDTDAHVEIRDVDVIGHGGAGILLDDADNVTITGSRILDNGGPGVSLDGADSVSVVGSDVHHNGGPGLLAQGGTGLTVADTDLRQNGGAGADLQDLSDATVEENEVHDNAGPGVRVHVTTATTVTTNTVEDNGGNGVFVTASDGFTVDHNVVQANGGTGLQVQSSTDGVLHANTVEDNAERGIDVRTTDASVISKNTVRLHPKRAVVLSGADANVVQDNTVEDNDHVGFFVKSDDTTIRRNVARRNLHGVVVSGSGNVVNDNNIHDNEKLALFADTPNPLDATGNWWGASNGPGGGLTDACTGTTASGDGGAIDSNGAGICFDPWLGSPNTRAG